MKIASISHTPQRDSAALLLTAQTFERVASLKKYNNTALFSAAGEQSSFLQFATRTKFAIQHTNLKHIFHIIRPFKLTMISAGRQSCLKLGSDHFWRTELACKSSPPQGRKFSLNFF